MAILMPLEENLYIVPQLKALIRGQKFWGGQKCGSTISLWNTLMKISILLHKMAFQPIWKLATVYIMEPLHLTLIVKDVASKLLMCLIKRLNHCRRHVLFKWGFGKKKCCENYFLSRIFHLHMKKLSKSILLPHFLFHFSI